MDSSSSSSSSSSSTIWQLSSQLQQLTLQSLKLNVVRFDKLTPDLEIALKLGTSFLKDVLDLNSDAQANMLFVETFTSINQKQVSTETVKLLKASVKGREATVSRFRALEYVVIITVLVVVLGERLRTRSPI